MAKSLAKGGPQLIVRCIEKTKKNNYVPQRVSERTIFHETALFWSLIKVVTNGNQEQTS